MTVILTASSFQRAVTEAVKLECDFPTLWIKTRRPRMPAICERANQWHGGVAMLDFFFSSALMCDQRGGQRERRICWRWPPLVLPSGAIDLFECIISYARLLSIIDYYQKGCDSMLCIVDCILHAHTHKNRPFEGRHQKTELLLFASQHVAINKCIICDLPSLFLSLSLSHSIHPSLAFSLSPRLSLHLSCLFINLCALSRLENASRHMHNCHLPPCHRFH